MNEMEIVDKCHKMYRVRQQFLMLCLWHDYLTEREDVLRYI